jgi:ABC-2 type transport system ATP-binding protein
MSNRPAVLAEGLVKRFGETTALDGLDLAADEGTVLGVLGPNGAGKTTAVRIFTTLLTADGGYAEVSGLDVAKQPDELRRRIGLAGQYAAVDEYLTGRENLEMVGRLYHLSTRSARARADELLDRFGLTDAGRRPAKTYSGGMRRRLDLAASLVVAPPVLFLDEPTTGLDPRSRLAMWDVIEDLVREGTTLVLTTQYLEEADQLAHKIAVIDGGRVIAEGTSDELKHQVGGDRLEVAVAVPAGRDGAALLEQAAVALRPHGAGDPIIERGTNHVILPVHGGTTVLPDVIRDLDAAGIPLADIGLRRPTLDDAFLALTGHRTQLDDEALDDEEKKSA